MTLNVQGLAPVKVDDDPLHTQSNSHILVVLLVLDTTEEQEVTSQKK